MVPVPTRASRALAPFRSKELEAHGPQEPQVSSAAQGIELLMRRGLRRVHGGGRFRMTKIDQEHIATQSMMLVNFGVDRIVDRIDMNG